MSDSNSPKNLKLNYFRTSSVIKKQPEIKIQKERSQTQVQRLVKIHQQKVEIHQQKVEMHQQKVEMHQPEEKALSMVDTTYSDEDSPAFKEPDSNQETINKILLEQQTSIKQCHKLEIDALKRKHETEIIEQQQIFKQEMNSLEKTHLDDLKKKTQMHCSICDKTFVNKKFFENHNKSNSHLNNLKKLYRSNFPDTETKSSKDNNQILVFEQQISEKESKISNFNILKNHYSSIYCILLDDYNMIRDKAKIHLIQISENEESNIKNQIIIQLKKNISLQNELFRKIETYQKKFNDILDLKNKEKTVLDELKIKLEKAREEEHKRNKQIISEVDRHAQHKGIKRERDFTETEGSVVVVSEPSDSVVVSEPPLKKVRASAGLDYLFKSEEVMNLKSEESITKHGVTFTKIDEFTFMQYNYRKI